MNSSKVLKVRPAIYMVAKSNFGWNSLAELAEIVEMDPVNVWVNYFALNLHRTTMDIVCDGEVVKVHAHGSSKPIESPAKDDMPDGIEGFAFGSAESFIKHLMAGDILIPAGWTEKVLRADSENVGSVSLNGDNMLPRIWLTTYLEQYGQGV